MGDQTFQIQCIKVSLDESGRLLKDKDGNAVVADKSWKGPSGSVYNFCKRGKGALKTALLPFDDAAKALTYPSVFCPGPECKNEDLVAIFEQAVEQEKKRVSEMNERVRARAEKEQAMSDSALDGRFVSLREYDRLLARVAAMEGELEAVNKLLAELK